MSMSKIARGFLLDNMLSMSAFWVGAGTAIASLCSYYGIPLSLSNVMVGLTATLPVLQLAGSMLYARAAAPRRFVVAASLLWRMCLPLAFLSVALPAAAGRPVFVVLYALGVLLYELANPVQNSWMALSVGRGAPANYYALRETCFMLTYTGAFCVANLFLARGQATGAQRPAFLALGILLAVLLCGSDLVLLRLPAEMPAPRRKRLPGMIRGVWQNRAFRQVLLFNMAYSFCSMLVGSYSALYQVQVLNISFVTLMVCGVLASLLRTACTPFVGRAAARWGWNRVLSLCMAVYASGGFVWLMLSEANRFWTYPLASMLLAAPLAGTSVGILQLQVETTPEQERSDYFALSAAGNGVASLAGSAVCSLLIALAQERGLGLQVLFAPGTVCVLGCAAAALRLHAGARRQQ